MLNIYSASQAQELAAAMRDRAENIPAEIINSVAKIIDNVRERGDKAVREYSMLFDSAEITDLYLSEDEKKQAVKLVPQSLKEIIKRAAENIYAFHEKQKQVGYIDASDGKIMGQRVIPLSRVGLYVPGGTASYPSSVLMSAIPAAVAGVNELIIATPPKKGGGINPAVVYAAEIAGVNDIITVGGAQAVAALAYGTKTIKRVDKIVGPGNAYVSAAKRLVYGTVDIDMIAGPSEVLIIADSSADARYIAADLMSQAEHDLMAASVLITDAPGLIERVNIEIEKRIKSQDRKDIIRKSLKNYGAAILVNSLREAVWLSNTIAPEHLEIACENPFELLGLIKNAGSVFLGHNTPEPLGDYYAGPNHILPTNGTARFASALSVDSFIKKSSYIYYSKEALEAVKDDVIAFAQAEGLQSHADSIAVRFENE